MLEAAQQCRTLGPADLRSALSLLAEDPVTNVFVDARVRTSGLDRSLLGGQLWGYEEAGQLISLCYNGPNLVPVAATAEAVRAFADRAEPLRAVCSSVWGPREVVAPLWERLEPSWGPPRAVRDAQPFMVATEPADILPDPLVRRVTLDELDLVYPACVAFFVEELGVSPELHDGGTFYRSRVADLVREGRMFARIENGRVVFKAEVGVSTSDAFPVQGVWIAPDRRGEGLAAPAVTALLTACLGAVAPVATLYVNDFNLPARRAYAQSGFVETGTFMTVLL